MKRTLTDLARWASIGKYASLAGSRCQQSLETCRPVWVLIFSLLLVAV